MSLLPDRDVYLYPPKGGERVNHASPSSPGHRVNLGKAGKADCTPLENPLPIPGTACQKNSHFTSPRKTLLYPNSSKPEKGAKFPLTLTPSAPLVPQGNQGGQDFRAISRFPLGRGPQLPSFSRPGGGK